jgi:hypothetical protein
MQIKLNTFITNPIHPLWGITVLNDGFPVVSKVKLNRKQTLSEIELQSQLPTSFQ